ncbi:MAG: DUF1116 domain-containing protein [Burkholderiaceae bacterium]|nr:DUF1116 domain-containing protein [Burkholderiaceae bacterium]
MTGLFGSPLHVVNVGLASFGEPVVKAGAGLTHLDWAPPALGDRAVARDLASLLAHPKVEAANKRAFEAYGAAQPVLESVGTARNCVPGMGERTILHAGPPIEWGRMCGPVQGAVLGAIVYEGWAQDVGRARALAASGEIALAPCHDHDAVGPMAGIISPSMPVWVVRNASAGNSAMCNMNEGLGKVLRFGANSPEVIARLRWIEKTLAPVLQASLKLTGPIELKPLMAQALHMGDELHNRNAAASSLLLKRLIMALLKSGAPSADIAAAVEFIAGNDHFFLNVSMAACKAMLDAARGVEGSSMVTAMCRNGVDFGVRLSGTGDAWFTAPAPVVDGLYFAGYSKANAAPDLGDSAITETAGLGGFAMAAAPAIVKFVGGTPQDAIANTLAMTHITLGRNSAFTLPPLNFGGTPAAIDARKVVDSGLLPVINTGIAHSEAGVGQIGAGVTHAPMACFSAAVSALAALING